MRLDIRYQMNFTYAEPVREAHNEVRVRPRDMAGQRLLGYRISTAPITRVLSFTDYWGTRVEHFGHVQSHDRLEIVAEAAVETRPRPVLESAPMAAFDEAFRVDNAELLQRSPHVDWTPEHTDMARDALAGIDDAKDAIAAIVNLTRSRLYYERDSTHIGISLESLVNGGRGVCQDFAHLTIGFMRSVGIPARYVSGYLFAADETDLEQDEEHIVQVLTHAWVEAAIPGQGWFAVDPTNDHEVGERHVVVGHGRDYDDVAPVRGVYVGEVSPEVEASVEMRRMEQVDRTLSERPRRRHQPIAVDLIATESAAHHQQQQQQQQ